MSEDRVLAPLQKILLLLVVGSSYHAIITAMVVYLSVYMSICCVRVATMYGANKLV